MPIHNVIRQQIRIAGIELAVTAQFAAELVSTGNYGKGEALFKTLPKYVQEAIAYLTAASSTSVPA